MAYEKTFIRVLLLLCVVVESTARNDVNLIDNKYTTLLIAINENVDEDHQIVENLQAIYKDASEELYQATSKRAAYGEITILIPKTWSDNITMERATTETYDIANVIVDNANPDYGDIPYVKQHEPCGEKAEYMHLTPRWIVDREWSEGNFGDSGKVVVHEWGHMQWGLFDEYGTRLDNQYYTDASGIVEATRCSLAITGKSYDNTTCHDRYGCELCNTDPQSGIIPGKECVFFPDEPNVGTGSYMYFNYLESVVHFCHSEPNRDDNSRHNPEAPNDQNEQCRHKSAWEVMDESLDFLNKNPPMNGLDTTPTFKVVKETEFRTVLVMDVSGSMSSYNRMELQHQAASKYIGNTLPLNSWVGIVEFGTAAKTLASLTKIVDDETRENLIKLIPTITSGSTCIGCGLEEGIEVLEKSSFGYAAGGIIFLTTDGKENVHPYIEDVLPDLIAKEVIVDTLAFSDSADPKLIKLSDETGGRACWYSEGDDSTALHDCFTASVTERTSSSTETPVQLASYKTTIAGLGTEISTIYIDSTVGRDTIFFFFWDFGSNHEVDVIITRPNGTTIDTADPQYNSDVTTRSIYVKIDGLAEVGEWTYHIYNPATSSQVVEVSVDSKSVESSTHPIRLSSNPSTDYVTESPPMAIIYADLNQGYSPVLEAQVIATVERPSPHSVVDVQLFDSGTGADIKKDDGVYSGYFVDFIEASCSTECRYSIQVNADNEDDTAQIRMMSRVGAMPRNYSVIPRNQDSVPIGDFNRVVQGGMIQVDDAVDYVDWSDPNDDPFPPARITDQRVTNTSYDNATVTLQWTATGDDMDKGTASLYDLRYHTNFSQILYSRDSCDRLTNADLTEGTLTDPRESGQTETVTAALPSSGPGFTYYFSIRAIDDVGNAGDSSNIAQTTIVAAVPPPVLTTEIMTTTSTTATQTIPTLDKTATLETAETTTNIITTTSATTTVYHQQPILNGVEGWQIAVLLATVCVLTTVVVVLIVGLYMYYKKMKMMTKVVPIHLTQAPMQSQMTPVESNV
ncbi:calcium-activated chloride channel regulator 1-like [Glandiceps talaboti]